MNNKKNSNNFEISNLLDKINKEFLEKQTSQKLVSRISLSDYTRIKTLYRKWWSLLWSTTWAYLCVYLCFQAFKVFILKTIEAKNLSRVSKFFLNTLLVILRGLIFSSDGVISSWLKTPFGQICYAINKSKIEVSIADDMVTKITEINEHFKETFKKFGILSISQMVIEVAEFLNFLKKDKVSFGLMNMRELWSLSLAVPIALAFYGSRGLEKMMNEIEVDVNLD